jgi:hypothetical protein
MINVCYLIYHRVFSNVTDIILLFIVHPAVRYSPITKHHSRDLIA